MICFYTLKDLAYSNDNPEFQDRIIWNYQPVGLKIYICAMKNIFEDNLMSTVSVTCRYHTLNISGESSAVSLDMSFYQEFCYSL